jgi:hypothetical protein
VEQEHEELKQNLPAEVIEKALRVLDLKGFFFLSLPEFSPVRGDPVVA